MNARTVLLALAIKNKGDWSNNRLISDGAFILYEQGQLA